MSRSLLTSRMMSCCPIAIAPRPARLFAPPRFVRTVRVHQHGNCCRLGHELAQQLQSLRPQHGVEKTTPVTLPPGRLRLATRPSLTGSLPVAKTIGIVVVAALAASAVRRRCRRSRPPAGGSNQPPEPATDQCDLPPSGIRSRRSGPRRSRLPSGPGGTRSRGASSRRATCCGETRSPASPAAARARRAASTPPRRREA